MAYVRTKKIKGHTYHYLVEGKREGKKVRQRVIAYLGAGEPSSYFIGRVREIQEQTDMTPAEYDEAFSQAAVEENARQTALSVFEEFEVTVRHNIPDSAQHAGQIWFDGQVPDEVTFKAEVEPDTVVHELGHLIDAELSYRAGADDAEQSMFSTEYLTEHPRAEELQAEFSAISTRCYFDEYLALTSAKWKSEGWGISSWMAALERRSLEQFFKNYANRPEEAFANCFAMLMLNPALARREAPILCGIIAEEMNKHDDLRAILDEFQGHHKSVGEA